MQIMTEWLGGFTSGLISCRLAFSNAILQLVLVRLVAAVVVLMFWHHVTHPNPQAQIVAVIAPGSPKDLYITRFHLNVISNVVPASKQSTHATAHTPAGVSQHRVRIF